MRRLGTTSLNANPWFLLNADGTEQRANTWESLDWDKAEWGETARQEEELHQKIFTEMVVGNELGHGTFGVAYACKFPSLSPGHITIKLPLDLFKRPAELWVEQGRLKQKHQSTTRFNVALANFKDEFSYFEQIYEPRAFHDQTKFRGGMLAFDLDKDRYEKMMKEMIKMKLDPGRAHIHRVIHFDASIPAIFSEQCDGSLEKLRQRNPPIDIAENLRKRIPQCIFDVVFQGNDTWKMSAEWLRVGQHVGSAMAYMLAMNVVHLDIKTSNILYQTRPDGKKHYMVSDFGFCTGTDNTSEYDKCRTTNYYEPVAWRQQSMLEYNPMQLSVYTFAALMVCCLKLPTIIFPLSAEKADFKSFRNIDSEIAYFAMRNQTIATFFPPYFIPLSDEFQTRFPEWSYILKILRWDYLDSREKNTFGFLANLLQLLQSQADAEMPDA